MLWVGSKWRPAAVSRWTWVQSDSSLQWWLFLALPITEVCLNQPIEAGWMSRVAWWVLTPTLHFAPVLCAATGHFPAEGLPVIALFISVSMVRSLGHSAFRLPMPPLHTHSPSREDSKKYVNPWFYHFSCWREKINNGRGVLTVPCCLSAVSLQPLLASCQLCTALHHYGRH